MTPFLLPGGATDVSSQARPGTRGRCAKAGLEAAQGEGETQNKGSTQPTGRRAVASAAEGSREAPHPLTRTPGGPGRPAKEVGGSTGQRQGTGRADLRLEPNGRLGACRRRTRRGPLPPTHHPGPRQATFFPVPPDRGASAPPSPAGTSAASSRDGIQLPALPLQLRAPAPPGGGAMPGAELQRRGRGRPGSLRRREAQRAGTGSLAAGSLKGCPTTGPAQPSKLSGLQSLAEKQEQMYLPSQPSGRARPGQLVLSSIPEQSKCSGSAAIHKHSARKHWALPYTRSRVFLEHLRQVSPLTYNWRN